MYSKFRIFLIRKNFKILNQKKAIAAMENIKANHLSFLKTV